MILREFLRLSSKHRTLYFYLLLWILLIFLGMYKYVSTDAANGAFLPKSFYMSRGVIATKRREAEQIEKFRQRYCNDIPNLVLDEEGGYIEGWTLQGVIVLIRHGDRSSLVHVRDIHSIDCSYEHDQHLSRYRSYLLNSSLINNQNSNNGASNTNTNSNNNNGHVSWNRQGPFHGFPLLPADPRACLLGQLTYKGIAQLLHIGEIFKFAYAHALDLYRKPLPIPAPRLSSAANHSDTPPQQQQQQQLNSDEIVVYSTRYRRTFQSAMALLFNLLPVDRWHGLQVQESHSLAFCFNDCACANAELLKRVLARESAKDFASIPSIAALVNYIGASLLQIQDAAVLNPLDIRDALLMYVCHNQPLPCQRNAHMSTTQPQHEPESNDIIDLDESQHSPDATTNDAADDDDLEEAINDQPSENCVEQAHIEALLAYTNAYEVRESNNRNRVTERVLRAYGLIRNIVSYMLKMISGDKVKLVLYSCHDQTIQYVLATLGLLERSSYVPYATRLAFEVYRSDKDNQHYYRAVYNGRDVTRLISFCTEGKSLRVKRGRAHIAHLCPIENIIRFIHDDYFAMMNATNFKDACLPQTDRNSYF